MKPLIITQSLETIFDDCLIEGLQLSARGGVELEKNVLIEDDSAGAGIGEDEKGVKADNFDRISDTLRIRKEIFVEDAKASGAILAFYANTASPLDRQIFFVSANGAELPVPPFETLLPQPLKQWERRRWYYLPLPPELIKKGKNEFIFYTKSKDALWEMMISEEKYFPAGSGDPAARAPGHSARSKDGGRTWEGNCLGVKNNIRGEYNVRLNLDQFRPEGRITSGVLDAGADPLSPDPIGARGRVRQVAWAAEGVTPQGTAVALEARSGETFAVDEQWSPWKKIDNESYQPKGRFLQWRAELRTEDASVSPVLKKVTISSEIESGSGAYTAPSTSVDLHVARNFKATLSYSDGRAGPPCPAALPEDGRTRLSVPTFSKFPHPEPAANSYLRRVAVREYQNEKIVRTSYPYEYEKFDQPLLVELRRAHSLDDAVAGAQTEWEKILKLKTWAGWQNAQVDLTLNKDFQFPDWNAHQILAGRGVFCLHHAIVFMQACLAFGIQCRHVQINALCRSGHEVNEVWSNDYKKWIFIDASSNYYVCDPATDIPLSLQELQAALIKREKKELLLQVLPDRAPIPVTMEIEGDLPVKHVIGPSAMNKKHGVANFERHHLAWIFFMRIIPRNNFLAKKHPLPLNQGTSRWPWNGYINWRDSHTPRLPHYSKYVYKKGDLYWTLNQTEFRLLQGEKEGEIMVHLDTVTPDFQAFEARLDEKEWQGVKPVFAWQLHQGDNRLELRSRNRAGGEGIVSHAVLAYSG